MEHQKQTDPVPTQRGSVKKSVASCCHADSTGARLCATKAPACRAQGLDPGSARVEKRNGSFHALRMWGCAGTPVTSSWPVASTTVASAAMRAAVRRACRYVPSGVGVGPGRKRFRAAGSTPARPSARGSGIAADIPAVASAAMAVARPVSSLVGVPCRAKIIAAPAAVTWAPAIHVTRKLNWPAVARRPRLQYPVGGSGQPRPLPATNPAEFLPNATTRSETRTSATTVAVRRALRSATAVSSAATYAALAATLLFGPRLCPSRASALDLGSPWLLSAWRWSPNPVHPAHSLCSWPAVGTTVSVHSPAQSCGRTRAGDLAAVP